MTEPWPPCALGFGCVGLTRAGRVSEVRRLLETARDHGITYFDTAPVYGQGYAERILGAVFGDDDKVVVATKVGLAPSRAPTLPIGVALAANRARGLLARRRAGTGSSNNEPTAAGSSGNEPGDGSSSNEPTAGSSNNELTAAVGAQLRARLAALPPLSLASVMASVHASRRHLRRERLDVLLLHERLPSCLTEDALSYLLDLRAEGLIGRLGIAADGRLYDHAAPDEFAGWDILQYQANDTWPGHRTARAAFANLIHVRHSVLNSVRHSAGDAAARLARQVADNPGGVVLFSSSKPANIIANAAILKGV